MDVSEMEKYQSEKKMLIIQLFHHKLISIAKNTLIRLAQEGFMEQLFLLMDTVIYGVFKNMVELA